MEKCNDKGFRFRIGRSEVVFPALAVISAFIAVFNSSQPGPCRTVLKIPGVDCAFLHANKRSPTAYSRRVVNSGGHWYRVQLQYYCFRCTLERITLSTSKYKTIPAVLHNVLIGALVCFVLLIMNF